MPLSFTGSPALYCRPSSRRPVQCGPRPLERFFKRGFCGVCLLFFSFRPVALELDDLKLVGLKLVGLKNDCCTCWRACMCSLSFHSLIWRLLIWRSIFLA